MGIPSYFSHIMKTYNVIQTYSYESKHEIQCLYIDCNSFIYDAIYSKPFMTEDDICKFVSDKVLSFKTIFNPYMMYIAFDGVAPMAKMKQQRDRRFRSTILKNIEKPKSDFDTCNITPGTMFMNKIDEYMKRICKMENVFFSGSSVPGEGEHKIFEDIRSNKYKNQIIYIYGLDADLIILSLEHLHFCKEIFLIREDKYKEIIIVDICKLKRSIQSEIGYQNATRDYTTLSFLLGNDFLPHSPFLNIRTYGIENIMKCYKQTYRRNETIVSSDNQICWKQFKKLCIMLAGKEKEYLEKEINYRNHIQMNNDFKNKLLNLPIIERKDERLIDTNHLKWKDMYYRILFHEPNMTNDFIKHVCISYIEGLQWCLSYYNGKCESTDWYYKYAYPPLFSDMIQYIPEKECNMFQHHSTIQYHPLEQLCIVLPPTSYYLLPHDIQSNLLKLIEHFGHDTYNISLQWDFCTYIWEAHPKLFPIAITYIKSIVKKYLNKSLHFKGV